MKLFFPKQAWEDYLYWQKNKSKILEQVNTLIKKTSRQPFTGIGKALLINLAALPSYLLITSPTKSHC